MRKPITITVVSLALLGAVATTAPIQAQRQTTGQQGRVWRNQVNECDRAQRPCTSITPTPRPTPAATRTTSTQQTTGGTATRRRSR